MAADGAKQADGREPAEEAVARLAQLQALTAALSRSRSVSDVARAMLAHGPTLLGAPWAAVYVLGPGGETLDRVEHLDTSTLPLVCPLSVPVQSDASVARAARTEQPQWIDGPDGIGPRVVEAGVQAIAALPLQVGGRVIGAFSMGFPSRRALTEGNKSFAVTVADQCAQALDRALTQARAERAAERAARIQAVTAAFSEARTPNDVAAVVVSQGCAAFGAPRGLIGLLTDEGDALEIVQWVGYPPDAVAALQHLPMAVDAPLTEAVGTGHVRVFETVDATIARYPHLAGSLLPGALAAIPLAVHGRTLGALRLAYDEPRRFDEEDRAAMLAFGEQCAYALERSRLYETAARARTEAEAASRAKDDFLSMLSHELRTPLTAILGWANLLRTRAPEAPGLVRGLETIERNAKVLVQLIEDLLDVSRIVADKIRLDVRSIDPSSIVRAAVEVVRPMAEAKRIALETTIDRAIGRLYADPARLQQIAWNLLSNAVKFTPAGGRVSVFLTRGAETITLRVSDSGVGIAADFLPHVFERYRQAEASASRAQGGLGLGLTIAQRLVELHGGTITAASEGMGRGATFTVTLPVPRRAGEVTDDRDVTDRLTPFSVSSRLQGVSVLVVDDAADVRDLLSVTLEAQGARVTMAASAAEAMRAVERAWPDVLVSDIGMPEEDGYALLRKIRALAATREQELPALALTAYAGVADVRMAELAGFQRHLAKPVSPGALIAAVADLAGKP